MQNVSCEGLGIGAGEGDRIYSVCTVEKPLRLWRVPTKMCAPVRVCVCVCVSPVRTRAALHTQRSSETDPHQRERSDICVLFMIWWFPHRRTDRSSSVTEAVDSDGELSLPAARESDLRVRAVPGLSLRLLYVSATSMIGTLYTCLHLSVSSLFSNTCLIRIY